MKKMINAFLILICMIALLASVTPKEMITDDHILKSEVANANFKIPLPVEVGSQSTFVETETANPDYAQGVKLNTK